MNHWTIRSHAFVLPHVSKSSFVCSLVQFKFDLPGFKQHPSFGKKDFLMLLLKSLIALFLASVNFHNSSIMQAVILPQSNALTDGQIVPSFSIILLVLSDFSDLLKKKPHKNNPPKTPPQGLSWVAVYMPLLAFRQWNNIRQLCP